MPEDIFGFSLPPVPRSTRDGNSFRQSNENFDCDPWFALTLEPDDGADLPPVLFVVSGAYVSPDEYCDVRAQPALSNTPLQSVKEYTPHMV